MSLRRAALEAIRDVLAARIQLPAPPTIVAAPPSEPAVYPAMAILLDKFAINWTQNWDIEVDSSSQPLVGTSIPTLSTDPVSGRVVGGTRGVGMMITDGNRWLSKVGTLRGSGRVWVAARHPAKREEMEEEVILAFSQDPSAPGRMLATMVGVRVSDFVVPWSWTVAAILDDATWQSEFVFAERLWSYLRFDLDVDMLVPRADPLVRQFVVAYDVETAVSSDGTPRADGTIVSQVTLNDQGDVVQYP